jgi:Mor family transcriptional regulator
MSVCNAMTAETIAALTEQYKTGQFTQSELAEKYSVSTPTISNLLKGVKPEKRKYTISEKNSVKHAAIVERNTAIVAEFNQGSSTRELAAKHGVTHQNISLVLKAAGLNPAAAHKERIGVHAAKRTAVVNAAKEEKSIKKKEKLEALSALWKSGVKIGDIRESLGLKSDNATQVKIVLLRKKFPDLFPKRTSLSRGAVSDEEKLAKVDKLSTLWITGKSMEECAETVGWSKATFAHALTNLRKVHGLEKFPHRRQPKAEGESDAEGIDDFTSSPE